MHLIKRAYFDYSNISYWIFLPIAWGIFILILIILTIVYRIRDSRKKAADNSTNLELPLNESRLSTNSREPLNNEILSDESVDPLPLYSPPVNSSQDVSQMPSTGSNSVQIQITEPSNDQVQRAPTYRL